MFQRWSLREDDVGLRRNASLRDHDGAYIQKQIAHAVERRLRGCVLWLTRHYKTMCLQHMVAWMWKNMYLADNNIQCWSLNTRFMTFELVNTYKNTKQIIHKTVVFEASLELRVWYTLIDSATIMRFFILVWLTCSFSCFNIRVNYLRVFLGSCKITIEYHV